MNLYIDATDNLKTIIKIDDFEVVKNYSSPQEQDVLSAISEALHIQGLSLKDVTKIEVNPGPGSFTGTRVGVTIANALGFALNIPINGRKDPLAPIYSEPPHITKSKNKK